MNSVKVERTQRCHTPDTASTVWQSAFHALCSPYAVAARGVGHTLCTPSLRFRRTRVVATILHPHCNAVHVPARAAMRAAMAATFTDSFML